MCACACALSILAAQKSFVSLEFINAAPRVNFCCPVVVSTIRVQDPKLKCAKKSTQKRRRKASLSSHPLTIMAKRQQQQQSQRQKKTATVATATVATVKKLDERSLVEKNKNPCVVFVLLLFLVFYV